MARLTPEQWELVRVDYEIGGLSYSQLSEKHKVSKAAISAKVNAGGWKQGKTEQLIARKVSAIKEVNETERQTEQLNLTATERLAFDHEVQDRLEAEGIFLNAAMYNQKRANELLIGNPDAGMGEIEQHARITARNRDTVLGKQPDTAIQINNSTASSAIDELHKRRLGNEQSS